MKFSPGRNSILWVAAALAALAIAPLVRAQPIKAAWNGTELRVSASVGILSGSALERLKNGATVAFDFQLSLKDGPLPVRRALERFLVSYDLWEERFSVSRIVRDRAQRRSASHLTAAAAEAWCLENLPVLTAGLAPDRLITAHLEIRAEEPRDSPPLVGEPGISLTALIDLFSRPARSQQQRWNLESARMRLNDIRLK